MSILVACKQTDLPIILRTTRLLSHPWVKTGSHLTMSATENSSDKLCNQTTSDEDPTKPNLCLDNNIEDTFYGSQKDDVDGDQEIANRHYDEYISKFYNQGFREAMLVFKNEEGEDVNYSNGIHVLQKSFDQGYQTAFVISKELSTASTAVKTYLELLKEDTINPTNHTDDSTGHGSLHTFSVDHLRKLEQLNVDLDTAKVELGQLTTNEAIDTKVTPEPETGRTDITNNSSEERIAEIDANWRFKIKDALSNLQDLQIRCSELLSINF